jgi:hypothetical protein
VHEDFLDEYLNLLKDALGESISLLKRYADPIADGIGCSCNEQRRPDTPPGDLDFHSIHKEQKRWIKDGGNTEARYFISAVASFKDDEDLEAAEGGVPVDQHDRLEASSVRAQIPSLARRGLEYEDGIIWTEDIQDFDYVRQTIVTSVATRRRPVPWRGPGRRVGYSVLSRDAPSDEATGKYVRRVFWVKPYDRSEAPDGMYKSTAPSEAVDPRTVAPGAWGELTERAWSAPLHVDAQGATQGDDVVRS